MYADTSENLVSVSMPGNAPSLDSLSLRGVRLASARSGNVSALLLDHMVLLPLCTYFPISRRYAFGLQASEATRSTEGVHTEC